MNLATRRLGQSDLYITPVGMGTAPIGSTPEWRIYWGPQDEDMAMRAIHTGVEQGVNWIDTAPFYGWGRAEEIVGRALEGRRERVYIFTKCGTLRDERDNEYQSLAPASIRREVEGSLRRLGTDYIDLYQFHDPDPEVPIEESWGMMQELIQEGKIRYAGLSNHTIDLMERAQRLAPITSNQHQYSLLRKEIEQDVLPYSLEQHIGVLAWSPLASGFLTDEFELAALDAHDFRHRLAFAQEPFYSRLSAARERLRRIAQARQKSTADLAIAWLLRQAGLTGVIIGIRSPIDAQRMTAALDWQLTEGELEAIEEVMRGV